MPSGWGRKFDYNTRPRRAINAYAFYVQDNYRAVKWQWFNFDPAPARILREVGRQWKTESDETKKQYKEFELEDKARAKREKMEYDLQVAEGIIEPVPRKPRITAQPGYPKRPRTAYIRYYTEAYRLVSDENMTWNRERVMREVISRWRSMGVDERQPYVDRYKAEMTQYNERKRRFRTQMKAERRQKRREKAAERMARLQRLPHRKVALIDPVAGEGERA